jgi:hypothetical protein
MREEYMLAMHRESAELEWELIDRRLDEAFGQVYEYLEPAAAYLRVVCDAEGRRALEQLERAYLRAMEIAARSGLGLRPALTGGALDSGRAGIPDMETQVVEERGGTASGTDSVLHVRPIR